MYQLPACKGAALQRSYGIGGIFKALTRMFASVVKRVFWIWGNRPSIVEFKYWMTLVEEKM